MDVFAFLPVTNVFTENVIFMLNQFSIWKEEGTLARYLESTLDGTLARYVHLFICLFFYLFFFSSINASKIQYTHKHWQNNEKKKWLKTYKLRLIIDSKNCYQVWHIQVIIKILKNIRNIVELAVKVEKNNCNRLHSRRKPRY